MGRTTKMAALQVQKECISINNIMKAFLQISQLTYLSTHYCGQNSIKQTLWVERQCHNQTLRPMARLYYKLKQEMLRFCSSVITDTGGPFLSQAYPPSVSFLLTSTVYAIILLFKRYIFTQK